MLVRSVSTCNSTPVVCLKYIISLLLKEFYFCSEHFCWVFGKKLNMQNSEIVEVVNWKWKRKWSLACSISKLKSLILLCLVCYNGFPHYLFMVRLIPSEAGEVCDLSGLPICRSWWTTVFVSLPALTANNYILHFNCKKQTNLDIEWICPQYVWRL